MQLCFRQFFYQLNHGIGMVLYLNLLVISLSVILKILLVCKIVNKETAILKAFTLKIAILKIPRYRTAHCQQGHVQDDNTDATTDLPHPITPSGFLQFFDWRYLRPLFRTWRSKQLD